MEYRLSDDAQSDTVEIYSDGVLRWGAKRAEAYFNGIYDTFIEIADFPLANRVRSEISPGIRIQVYESHLIIYRVVDGGVEILRIVHGHHDWQNDL